MGGYRSPSKVSGQTFEKLICDIKTSDWRKYTFHEHFAVRNRIPAFEGIRGERYKYVRYVDEGKFEFLHDLKKDADELNNLAGNPKYRDILNEMRDLTDKRVKELGGPLSPMKGALFTYHGSIPRVSCPSCKSAGGRWLC